MERQAVVDSVLGFNRPKAISGLATTFPADRIPSTVTGFNRPKAISGLATDFMGPRGEEVN